MGRNSVLNKTQASRLFCMCGSPDTNMVLRRDKATDSARRHYAGRDKPNALTKSGLQNQGTKKTPLDSSKWGTVLKEV